MVNCALRPNVRLAIDLYCYREKEGLENDTLTKDDWSELEAIHRFLEIFNETTLDAEGCCTSLSKVLQDMDYLLSEFEAAGQDKSEYSPLIKRMCDDAWKKLKKYYIMTESTEVYMAALVLDPSIKWTYFEEAWEPWVADSKKKMSGFWQRLYKPENALVNPLHRVNKAGQSGISQYRQRYTLKVSSDEYEMYCQANLVNIDNRRPIDWWLEEGQQQAYPNLARMAVNVLSIPAMSDEPERLFSRASATITDERTRLRSDTVEALECLKSWTIQAAKNKDNGVVVPIIS